MLIVYKPDDVIRELRKLFSQYEILNKDLNRMLKHNIQAVLADNGIALARVEKNQES